MPTNLDKQFDLEEEFDVEEDITTTPTSTTAEDITRGMAQGTALGFADEITGAVEAGIDVFNEPEKLNRFLELYRKHQKESEKAYETAKERSPYLYGTGQLLGGIGTGLLTAGPTLASAGAALTRQQLAQLGAKELTKEVGKRALTGGATGAALGAIVGAGESKETLEQPLELSKDVLKSAALGGVLGAPLSALGTVGKAGIGKTEKFAKEWAEHQFPRQLLKSFKEGKVGTKIAPTEEFTEIYSQQQIADISDISNTIIKAEKNLTNKLYSSLEKARLEGKVVTPSAELKDLLMEQTVDGTVYPGLKGIIKEQAQFIGVNKAKQIHKLLSSFEEGKLDPRTAYELRKYLQELSGSVEKRDIASILGKVSRMIKEDIMEQVPEVEQYTKQLKSLISSGRETLASKGLPPEMAETWASDFSKPTKKLAEDIENLLYNLTSGRTSQQEASRTFSQLVANLDEFEYQNPGLLKELGLNKDKLIGDIKSRADDFAIVRELYGQNPFRGPFDDMISFLTGGAQHTKEGALLEMSNMAGRAVKTAKETGLPKFSRELFHAPESALRTIGTELQNYPALSHLGKALLSGLDNKSEASKNAILFAILQNPQARKLLEKEEVE